MKDIKLSDQDFVWVDSNYNPIETLDICFSSKDCVRWDLYDSILTEEEIDEFIDTLYHKGIAKFDHNNWMVRMTDLPNHIQKRYIKHYNNLNIIL
mgnify:FL=1|tara:strand:+ start:756 stop:1040 length:285 start_codon:yes stop_codon:yes gene_type:complete